MVNGRRFITLFIVRNYCKQAYFHNPGTEPLRPLTVGQLVDSAAEKWPDRKALVSIRENQELTFAEVKDKAEELGSAFLRMGMKPGDRIAAFGGNTVHWYLTAVAAAKLGLIVTGLNPNYEKDELLFVLKKVGVKAIVADREYKKTDYFDLLSKVVPELPKSPSSSPISSKELPSLEFIIFASDTTLPGSYRYEDVLNMATTKDELEEISSKIQPDEPFNIQFTSGTTGKPKATVLSHFGVANNAYFFGRRCGFHVQPSTICCQVPFFHIFGYALGIVSSLSHGATIVIPGSFFNKFETINALAKHKCTAIYGTPTMYVDLCAAIKVEIKRNDDLKAGLQNFTSLVSGGALCTPQLFTEMSHTFNCTNLQSAFGMSETSPITFTNMNTDTFEQRTTTVGCVVDHVEVKIVDEEGKMVPFGTPGEVWYRGYNTMLGYWDEEAKTGEMITSSRWLKSGDQMILTEQGYGTIVGRIKDQINRGGEKIMPSEVENVLESHPKIQEVHVIGVSDDRMGEEVCACVRVTDEMSLTGEDLKDFCKGKIARFKIPRYIRFMNEFPKTGTGKVPKAALRKIVEQQLKQESAEM